MDPTSASRKHAKSLAKDLSNCGKRYIVQIALKELGIQSDQTGFPLARSIILILCENRFSKLTNGAYLSAGALADPPMDNDQVCQAITRVIRNAWDHRNIKVWRYYFPEGTPGYGECPSNRQFLFAVVDFVELWEGCCEEVNYARK